MSSVLIVDIKNIVKKFQDFKAVDGVDLQIKKGEIYGLLGPNGAGKSTLIRMICGVLSPTAGSGRVYKYDISKDSELIKERIGYMSQKFSLYEDLTVMENLRFYTEIYMVPKNERKERIRETVNMAGLQGKENVLTKNLSGGWKQRLALGCTLIHNPEILILDEPTSAVDPVSRRIFWGIIYKLAKRGITILVTTHYMDEAESCDRVSFIFDGKIIGTGNPKKIIEEKNVKNLEEVFITFVEEIYGKKITDSFDELKFISGEH
jgi:ABC-2 type transport system ATP-binding protein